MLSYVNFSGKEWQYMNNCYWSNSISLFLYLWLSRDLCIHTIDRSLIFPPVQISLLCFSVLSCDNEYEKTKEGYLWGTGPWGTTWNIQARTISEGKRGPLPHLLLPQVHEEARCWPRLLECGWRPHSALDAIQTSSHDAGEHVGQIEEAFRTI